MLASDFIPNTRILLYLTGGVVVRTYKKEQLFNIFAVVSWESHFVGPFKTKQNKFQIFNVSSTYTESVRLVTILLLTAVLSLHDRLLQPLTLACT